MRICIPISRSKANKSTVEATNAVDLADHRLTLKQKKFAHAYLQTGNATESDRRAYNRQRTSTEAVGTEALRLLKHPGNTRAIAHYRRSKVVETMLTLEEHMIELKAICDAATASGQLSAAGRAEKLRSRLCGYYAVKIEHGPQNQLANMSNAELHRFIIDEAQALGIDLSAPKIIGKR